MNIVNTWHVCNPNLKGDIPDLGGCPIADPGMVLRGIIRTEIEGAETDEFNVYTPAISGRLERVVIIPDHSATEIPQDNFSMFMYQHYVEAPLINAGDTPYQETLDLLNGLAINIPNDAITHLTVFDNPPYPGTVITGILPELLVQDKLRLFFTDFNPGGHWATAYIYLYFSSGSGTGNATSDDGGLPVQMDFWGTLEDEAVLGAALAPLALGSITTPNLNAFGTVNAVYLIIKFDSRRNANVAANMTSNPQLVQIQKNVAGAWITGITVPNNYWYTNGSGIAGGMGVGNEIIGFTDIQAQIELGGGQSNVQITNAQANSDSLLLNGVQVGIRVIFT